LKANSKQKDAEDLVKENEEREKKQENISEEVRGQKGKTV